MKAKNKEEIFYVRETPVGYGIGLSNKREMGRTEFDQLLKESNNSKNQTHYLAEKGIQKILKKIAIHPDMVRYHKAWGYYIELNFQEIRKIALLLDVNEDGEWNGLSIGADFGSTVSQARSFYTNLDSYSTIKKLADWEIYGNLHLAFRNTNLVFLKSPDNSLEKYFNYWKSDVWDNFGGVPVKTLVSNYLNEYVKEGILIFDRDKQIEVKNRILNKGYSRINICPSLFAEHYISKAEVQNLDEEENLIAYIKSKMKEVLGILNHPLDGIFN